MQNLQNLLIVYSNEYKINTLIDAMPDRGIILWKREKSLYSKNEYKSYPTYTNMNGLGQLMLYNPPNAL